MRNKKTSLRLGVQVTARGQLARERNISRRCTLPHAPWAIPCPQKQTTTGQICGPATDLSLSLPTKLAVGLELKDVLCVSVLWKQQFTPCLVPPLSDLAQRFG